MLDDVVQAYVDGATSDGYAEDWDLDKLWTALGSLYPVGVRWQDVAEEHDELSKEVLREAVLADMRGAYARREAEIDEMIGAQGGMRELERQVLLQVMDRKWREHLYEMDYLKEGIGLRAMAQRDPLIEYQREGYDMFTAMLEGIKEETVGHMFNVRVQAATPAQPPAAAQPAAPAPAGAAPAAAPKQPAAAAAPPAARPAVAPPQPAARPAGQPARPAAAQATGRHAAAEPEPGSVLPAAFRGAAPSDLRYTGPTETGQAATRSGGGRPGAGRGDTASRSGSEPSRNRPCPCGSGRKYKQCHGSPTAARP
jgi:preprotein translocase subunit SecA